MTARPQDVALLPCPPEPEGWIYQHEDTGRMTTLENDGVNNPENFGQNNPRHVLCGAVYSAGQMRDYARANVTAALASAQAREEELRALLREVQPFIGWTGSYPELHAKIDAALSTNAATQTGETNEAAE